MSRLALLTFLSGWPRRIAAGVCLAAAAFSLLVHRGSALPTTTVLVTARPLAAGSTVRAADVRLAVWPRASVPPAAARSPAAVVGRRTATALAPGSPIGPDMLLEPAMARALASGQVATTISLSNADALTFVQPGSYVDLYPTQSDSSEFVEGKSIGSVPSTMTISSALVLSVVIGPDDDQRNNNPTLVIATSKSAIEKLTSHAVTTFLATLVPPP